MSSTFSAALRIDRNVRVRGAQRSTPVPGGIAIFREDLPTINFLNAVLLDAPLDPRVGVAELAALAQSCHPHARDRYLVLDDAEAAERLSPGLTRAGWVQRRTLFMAWRGEQPALDPRAEQVSDGVLRALQRRVYEETEFPATAPEGLPAALVEAQIALRSGTSSLCFGAGEGGLQSMSTLFLDEDDDGPIAMVEEVATLGEYRERGLARAVVSAAIDGALRAGAGRIVIPTDAEDWPQLLYAKLGFEPLGSSVSFMLSGGSGSHGV
ncbi:MAG TPA: GNAT family N-acetyltransferase [Solirubrobacteraceae bacterium]|jgi:GNAT superfamily N-acetyltransferase